MSYDKVADLRNKRLETMHGKERGQCIQKATESVTHVFEKVFGVKGYDIEISNFGMAVSLNSSYNNPLSATVYIRIEIMNGELALNINSIVFDPSMRGKGLFSQLIKELKTIPGISYILVTQIITPEMLAICKHLNFKACEYYDMDYYIKLN